MKILIACEHSGTVREAFRALGHDAWSCDILPASDGSPHHITGCAKSALAMGWDMAGLHPPCTYIGVSGIHWVTRGRIEEDGRPRRVHMEEALQFIADIWSAPVPLMYLENPVGIINTRLPFMPKPQYVQPYEFGDDASKKTGLWLKGLPWLTIDPAQRKAGRLVEWEGKMVERWANQTDSGQNALPPSDDRGHLRAITYPGIARAMAEQWGRPMVANSPQLEFKLAA